MRTVNPFYAARTAMRRNATSRVGHYNVLDLFSGIGGFSLGLERAGMETAAFCEIDPFCQLVLTRHWPHVPIYDDITQLTARRLHHDHIPSIDVICGGYPCQPFSIAGKQRGQNDPRHLWPEMYRLIREIRPRWVICENVAGHVELGLDTVLSDLEDAGYAAAPFIIPACAVGAPHRRDRIWIVAHAAGLRLPGPLGAQGRQSAQELPATAFRWELPAPFTIGSDDGIPCRMERTQALGNAVVPQIPELIGRAIIAYECNGPSRMN
jgi:DNA (cytosine-5)-methyltransferase 1